MKKLATSNPSIFTVWFHWKKGLFVKRFFSRWDKVKYVKIQEVINSVSKVQILLRVALSENIFSRPGPLWHSSRDLHFRFSLGFLRWEHVSRGTLALVCRIWHLAARVWLQFTGLFLCDYIFIKLSFEKNGVFMTIPFLLFISYDFIWWHSNLNNLNSIEWIY